jgi:hypothetical protein
MDNLPDRFVCGAHLISILDPENERTTFLSGKKPVK